MYQYSSWFWNPTMAALGIFLCMIAVILGAEASDRWCRVNFVAVALVGLLCNLAILAIAAYLEFWG